MTDDVMTPGGKESPTIGEVLDGEDITQLSDGEFDIRALKKYEHTTELEECCREAATELADKPYHGFVSHAQVMGRAMELLRQKYDLNAPKGWVPVLRTLRTSGRPVRGVDKIDESGVEEISERTRGGKEPHPEEVLTSSRSIFRRIDAHSDGALRKAATRDPELMAQLVRHAQKLGVPTDYKQGLEFIVAIIAQLKQYNLPIAPSLIEMRLALARRVYTRENVIQHLFDPPSFLGFFLDASPALKNGGVKEQLRNAIDSDPDLVAASYDQLCKLGRPSTYFESADFLDALISKVKKPVPEAVQLTRDELFRRGQSSVFWRIVKADPATDDAAIATASRIPLDQLGKFAENEGWKKQGDKWIRVA
jgi:hypothetical protein